MHEPRALLAPGVRAALARRGYRLDAIALQELLLRRAGTIEALGKLRAESNRLARESRHFAAPALRDRARDVRAQLAELEDRHRAVRRELAALLLTIPNVPAESTPDRPLETVRCGGQEHGGAAPAPARPVEGGTRAVLERALVAFLLDLHTREHGYAERAVPAVLTVTGAGGAPAPGGEQLGGLDRLPLALVAHRDGAVHLVRVCAAEDAPAQQAILVRHAAQCLTRLGLAYRVVRRPAAALDFAARATDDVEVWLPARRRYQPISACTDAGAFLARRAGIRLRGGAEPYPATLHARALPIRAALGAILERHRDAGGAVRIPDALLPYTASDS